MKRLSVSVLSAAAALLAACGPSKPKVDLAAEEKAVRDISIHWLDLTKARDAAGEAGLFAADGIAFRLHHEPISGPAAYQAFAAKDYADNPKGETSWTTTSVAVAASGDLAVETGTYHLTQLGPKGNGEDDGNFVTVYKKVNGAWKIAQDIAVSSKPEASPAKVVATKAPARKAPARRTTKAPAKTTTKKK